MYVIDEQKRKIQIPPGEDIMGVTSDEKSEVKEFEVKRYVGDVDLALMSIRINYINAGNEVDQYIVDDVEVRDENIKFKWLLSRNVTAYRGDVKFIVCAVSTDDDGMITSEWNTEIAKGVVLQGIEAPGGQYEEIAQDAIEGILLKVNKRVNDILITLPKDFTEITEDVTTVKGSLYQLESLVIKHGKNMLRPCMGTNEKAGIKVVFKNGYIVINGRSSGERNQMIDLSPVQKVLEKGKDYTITVKHISGKMLSQDGSATMLLYTNTEQDKSGSTGQAFGSAMYKDGRDLTGKITKYAGYNYQWMLLNVTPYYGVSAEFENYTLIVQVEEGLEATKVEPYESDLGFRSERYTDFEASTADEMVELLQNLIGSEEKRYRVHLAKGTYDVSGYADRYPYGLFINQYVELIADDPEETIIVAEFSKQNENFSPINMKTSGKMKNVTVKAVRCRYCVHDDWANTVQYEKTYERYIENCIFDAIQCKYSMAWGGGCRTGFNAIFKKCKFYSDGGYAFSYHSNRNFIIPANIEIDGCEFYTKLSQWAVRFGGYHSGLKNNVLIKNSILSGCYLYSEDGESEIDWSVRGGGNSVMYEKSTDDDDIKIMFADEIISGTSNDNITKGVAVGASTSLPYRYQVVGSNELCIGIAMHSAKINDIIHIRKKGIIPAKMLYGNLKCVKGDKIVVGASGILSVDNTAEEYIGKALSQDYILLK